MSELAPSHVVTVEVQGQLYPVRSTLDATYVVQLAAYVDEKIRAATEVAPGADTVRLSVLAALNIADELFRSRSEGRALDSQLVARAEEIERLVDQALTLVV